MKKQASNPLLAGSAFSLADSFGGPRQPALLVPSGPQQQQPGLLEANIASSSASSATGFLGSGGGFDINGALQSSFGLSEQDLLMPPVPGPPPPTPVSQSSMSPSLSKVSSTSSLQSLQQQQQQQVLGPPAPGVFLLPSSTTSSDPKQPSFAMGGSALNKNKNRYVAPPGIMSSSTVPAAASPPTISPTVLGTSNISQMNYNPNPSYQSDFKMEPNNNFPTSYDHPNPNQNHFKVEMVAHHWFYSVQVNNQEQWKPFSMIDSVAIEDVFATNPNASEPIPTDGGRYDVTISNRCKVPVYWQEEPLSIRRCSWFHRSNADGRWTPYAEDMAQKLEDQYQSAAQTCQWNGRLDVGPDPGGYVTLHSPTVMMHFPSNSTVNGNLDEWGQVKPQDPESKPRVVHRGLEGLPEIPDGEVPEVDHLVFMVHGIGWACDLRFRTINECLDTYRTLTSDLSERHFQSAHLSGRANRIEYLPVDWHKTLHGEDTGTDERLKPLTLKSIPKLRNFVNDTLLDILFYSSPVFCQTILNTVVSEINRMYTLFMVRNENFKGSVSLIGHSLGSLILFDVLTHQSGDDLDAEDPGSETKTPAQTDCPVSISDLFTKLEISEYADKFIQEGIDLEALHLCSEDDLKEAGLPLGSRKKLLLYLESSKKKDKARHGAWNVGPAGTGQPFVKYPRLCFEPSSFYAWGAPISMFLAVRGIDTLGPNFKLPTCPRFLNIFHPYDPVAYRIESLIKPECAKLRPVVVPHHKGRKRMHLELKDTVTKLMTTDIKQKIFDSLTSTLSTVYNIATGTHQEPEVTRALEDSMTKQAQEDELADQANPRTMDSKLNNGKRIDYVLQEAPLESFNEYLFALASHLCYWESEDTCLMILKDIYGQMGILSDEENAQKTSAVSNLKPGKVYESRTPILAPPFVPMGGTMNTNSATPILAPPPVPMGGSMPVSSSSIQSSTPILAPPPVPMGGTLSGPSTLLGPNPFTTASSTMVSGQSPVPTSNQYISQHQQRSSPQPMISSPIDPVPSASAGLAPQMFSPSVIGPSPIGLPRSVSSPLGPPPLLSASGFVNSKPSGGRYPKAYPTNQQQNPSATLGSSSGYMGMDPTAPIESSDKPIAPPPMGGFFSKK